MIERQAAQVDIGLQAAGDRLVGGWALLCRAGFWCKPQNAGGEPRVVNGMEPGDIPIIWNKDGRSIYLYRTGEVPAKVYQLDLATGKKTVRQQIVPVDTTGVSTIGPIHTTPDGKTYVYGFHRTLGDLYLVEGLK